MSKRNFILLIIILVIVVGGVFLFLYYRQPANNGANTNGTNFFSRLFNPFGNSTPTPPKNTNPPAVDLSGGQTPPPGNTEIPAIVKLKKVSSMPIAGYGLFQQERPITPPVVPPKTEFASAVRYVEKAQGFIYETFADNLQEQKFSNTVIPKVYDAYFGNKGQSVAMRYLKADNQTIETFVGNLPKETLGQAVTGTNEIKGTFLPDNVTDISISPDTSKMFYLFNVQDSNYENNVVGTTLNFSDNKKVQIFTSPFTEWLSAWANANMITLTTKPTGTLGGYMYTVDPTKKNLTEMLGNINGLTTLPSPDGKLVLYADNNLSLNVYHTSTRVSDTLGIRTLPEKCVWSHASDAIYCAVPKFISPGNYPDTWYQGEVSFSDQIWKVDMKTDNATLISDPLTVVGGEDVDGIKLMLDQDENYLFFVNKKDSFLWELGLK